MMLVSTLSCSANGHPEIQFFVDAPIASSSSWLTTYFEEQVASGVRFKALQTVQIGWMLVQLRADDSGCLELWEPDFDCMPIRWCRSANNTIRHLILQRSICEQLKCHPAFPSICHAGIISPDFLRSESITISRDMGADSDSGWVLTEQGYNGSEGEFMSLYQIALHKTCVVPFLALPPRASVSLRSGYIEINFGATLITSNDNTLLRQLADRPPSSS